MIKKCIQILTVDQIFRRHGHDGKINATTAAGDFIELHRILEKHFAESRPKIFGTDTAVGNLNNLVIF